jgi:predicted metal-dependent HD superfamily phosphohydrolase
VRGAAEGELEIARPFGMNGYPPTLDPARWTALWSRLRAQGDGVEVFTRLTAAYAEPTRAYHTASHIADCLALLDASRVAAANPDELEAAIWFHDAVYVAARSDNEERSAELARATLHEARVRSEVADRVGALVLQTRHGTTPSGPDAALLCDIDLSILGRSPEAFDLFERRIRQEYAMVPEAIYRRGRSDVLRGFLNRASIYQTQWFRERFESEARANLERVLTTLNG